MEKLRTFLKPLTQNEQIKFAENCGTSIGYLRKALSTGQSLGTALCVRIESYTHGSVSRKDLRPDDWKDHWPELR